MGFGEEKKISIQKKKVIVIIRIQKCVNFFESSPGSVRHIVHLSSLERRYTSHLEHYKLHRSHTCR